MHYWWRCFHIFPRKILMENPCALPWSMDSKWAKLLALIMYHNPNGIKRVKPMTSPTFGGDISHLIQDQLRKLLWLGRCFHMCHVHSHLEEYRIPIFNSITYDPLDIWGSPFITTWAIVKCPHWTSWYDCLGWYWGCRQVSTWWKHFLGTKEFQEC